jgi:hypothetical protein
LESHFYFVVNKNPQTAFLANKKASKSLKDDFFFSGRKASSCTKWKKMLQRTSQVLFFINAKLDNLTRKKLIYFGSILQISEVLV